jgi:hypothetical protein
MNRLGSIKYLFLSALLFTGAEDITFIPVSFAQQTAIPSIQPLFEPPVSETPLPSEVRSEYLELKIDNNLVYLKAKGVNLKELLTRLGEQAGFEVSVNSSTTTISSSIEGLPVEETIHRIMNMIQERNYNIFYNEKGDIKKLEVFSSLESTSSAPQQTPQKPGVPRFRRPVTPQNPPPQGQQIPQQEIQPPARVFPQEEDDQLQ